LALYKAYTKKDKQLTICVIIERIIAEDTCQLNEEPRSLIKKEAKAKAKPRAKKLPTI
jgi:hypothetical protein